ncbi:MAG: hypothetical protein JKY48_16205 [Flavobacteriales bacterium]|nr:hypothetical protein [Flavobacteriales bacterium]
MKFIIIFVIISSLTGSYLINKTKELEKDLSIHESDFIDSTKFPFQELSSFDLRNWDYGKRSELKTLNKKDYDNYLQNVEQNYKIAYEKNYKYFSIQKNSKEEKIITLIVEHKESGNATLHLLVYNKKDKLLSNNIVASTGGDGGSDGDSYGSFINDSTYTMTGVGTQMTTNEKNEEVFLLDSVIRTFRFYKDKDFINISEEVFPQKTLDSEMIKTRYSRVSKGNFTPNFSQNRT